jgi:hypothetical protein
VYALRIEQAERRLLLAVLGVDKDPRDDLDEPLGVRSWPLPGARLQPPRPASVAREVGAPVWWAGDEDASAGFARALGVRL